jgi:peptidoglycan hydrolase-like protein with peptidoglycan-binding domain
MSSFKRFLLGSIGVFLLAGLMFASHTKVSGTAFASGCNSVATHSWSNNCTVSEGNISGFVYVFQLTLDIFAGIPHSPCPTSISIDGNFGPQTFSAVECFQRAKGLSVDGIVGPQTWGALYNTLFANQGNPINGWDYYDNGNFRMWNSSGVWYYENATTFKYCQMNLSSPC